MPFNVKTNQFNMVVTPRPRKIAFFVDPQNCPKRLLDRIIEFNSNCWGGRYNPIIPILNGEISEEYWALLKFSDPDIIYTFVELDLLLIKKIHKEISPMYFKLHREYNISQNKEPIYRIAIENQIEINDLYGIINKSSTDPLFPPMLLSYCSQNDSKDFCLIKRNFGTINERILPNRIPSEINTLRLSDKDYTFAEILNEISSNRNVITPIQLSEIYSQYYEPKYYCENKFFVLVVGDDIWDFLYFWNRNIILPSYRRKMISQLCIPLWAIESNEQRIAIRDFISKTFWPSGDSGVTVMVVSHEVDEETIASIGKSISTGSQLYTRVKRIKTNTFIPFQIEPIVENSMVSRYFQLTDSSSKLENIFPSFLDNVFINNNYARKKWMLDYIIEYHPEKFSYTNISYYWNLPKKLNISQYFIKNLPGRIKCGGWLSFETGDNKRIIELNVPSDYSVIYSYLIGTDKPYYSDDIRKEYLKKKEKENIKKDIKISDKGYYTRGVIKKFPSLWHSADFIKNRFWRSLLEELCHTTPDTKEKLLEPIINKIDKIDPSIWNGLSQKDKEKQRWFANFILNIAKNLHAKEAKISFNDLLLRLKEEREEFIKIVQNPTQFDISYETNRNDLIENMSSLVKKGVFEQGVEIRCNYCGSTFWYGLEELKKEIFCHGCQSVLSVDVESPWIYKLNDLIRNAISFHGIFPVIWTLGELQFFDSYSFIYLPGVCLYKTFESQSPYAEIDIAYIKNGKFAIGEIKTSSEAFNQSEIDKFIKICREIEPDKAIIGAIYDNNNKIHKLKQKIQNELMSLGIEVDSLVPREEDFKPSYHIVI